jgi:hypothetical protein
MAFFLLQLTPHEVSTGNVFGSSTSSSSDRWPHARYWQLGVSNLTPPPCLILAVTDRFCVFLRLPPSSASAGGVGLRCSRATRPGALTRNKIETARLLTSAQNWYNVMVAVVRRCDFRENQPHV